MEGVAALRNNFDTVSPDKVCQADRATVVLEGHRASFVFALYNSVVLIGREGRVLRESPKTFLVCFSTVFINIMIDSDCCLVDFIFHIFSLAVFVLRPIVAI